MNKVVEIHAHVSTFTLFYGTMPAQTRYVTVDLIVKGNDATERLCAFLNAKNYYVQRHEWNDDSN